VQQWTRGVEGTIISNLNAIGKLFSLLLFSIEFIEEGEIKEGA